MFHKRKKSFEQRVRPGTGSGAVPGCSAAWRGTAVSTLPFLRSAQACQGVGLCPDPARGGWRARQRILTCSHKRKAIPHCCALLALPLFIRLYAYTLIRVPSPGLLYPLVTGRYGGALATAAPFSLRTFPPALPSAVRIRQSCSAGPASSLNARPKATGYLVRPGRLPAHASSLAAGPPRPAGEQCQNRNRRLPVCQHGRRHACPWCRPFSVQHGYGYGRRRLFF